MPMSAKEYETIIGIFDKYSSFENLLNDSEEELNTKNPTKTEKE